MNKDTSPIETGLFPFIKFNKKVQGYPRHIALQINIFKHFRAGFEIL